MGIKRETSVNRYLLKYLISITAGVIFTSALTVILLISGIKMGFYYPANHIETSILKSEKELSDMSPMDLTLIPEKVKYVFIDNSGKILKSNVTDEEEKEILKSYREDSFPYTNGLATRIIRRTDGTLILKYPVKPFYRYEWMNQYLPDFSYLGIIFFVISSVAVVALITVRFSKNFRKETEPILEVTRNISEHNLDFEIRNTKFRELNEILNSINMMKTDLKLSLAEQWESDKKRKEEVSALAHDIKTPLTVISGNAEFLESSDLTDRQKIYVNNIMRSEEKIEKYIISLINANFTDDLGHFSFEEIRISTLISMIQESLTSYSVSVKRNIRFTGSPGEGSVTADRNSIERSLLNIASNAYSYTDTETLEVNFTGIPGYLKITVLDEGLGFSEEKLENIRSSEFSGKTSSSANFGIGLYSAGKTARAHNGYLEAINRKHSGAAVSIVIPAKFNMDKKEE